MTGARAGREDRPRPRPVVTRDLGRRLLDPGPDGAQPVPPERALCLDGTAGFAGDHLRAITLTWKWGEPVWQG